MPNNHRKQGRKRASAARIRDFKEDRHDDGNSGWQRSKLKGRGNRALIFADEKDVTLEAFADNACGKVLSGRLSKAAAMSISKEIKRAESASAILTVTAEEEVIDDWYERTFSDDEDTLADESTDQDEEKLQEDKGSKVTPEGCGLIENGNDSRLIQPQIGTITTSDVTGRVYPSVIWYLVSAYIFPEDIASFACLCHDTYAVTQTAGFWRKLYYRYYNLASKLPKELHPTSIQRTFGLRSLVIRALQFIYPPFIERSSSKTTVLKNGTCSQAIENMSGMTFMYHVSKRKGTNYIYYLKFRKSEPSNHESLRAVEALNRDPDIYFNHHRGQCILMVSCKQTHHLEPERIMGKELAYASVGVSSGMSYSRLKLEFQEPTAVGQGWQSRSKHCRQNHRRERTVVVLDPILYARVFHWWHPLFHEEFRTGEGSIPTNNDLNMWYAR